ncbi:MAG: glycosyltransferase [Chloroflexota bacterium]
MTSAQLGVEVDAARASRERLLRRRSVRLVLRISPYARPVTGLARRLTAVPRRSWRAIRRRGRAMRKRTPRASRESEAALLSAIHRDSLPTSTINGPLVSIVILNRNGQEHLPRCLGALARTAYQNVELIVVDNGSTDDSPDFAETFPAPFPISVIRNAENRSFSEANGQGVAQARGELICFLNNDVDPITDGWLGYLVETMTSTSAVAVGARLIYPRHRGGARAGAQFPDLTLQHAGVAFDRSSDIPLARVIGAGDDPLAPFATAVEEKPALTAACLLVERQAFEDVGGFTLGYDYGIEDVDLCLKLRAAGGRLVYDGRAALWHHESATRFADVERYRRRVASNRELFIDTWGPRIFREAMLDALAGARKITLTPFHIAITVTSHDPDAGSGDWYTGHELGDALEALGWRVSYLERANGEWYRPDSSVDAVIVLLDKVDIRRMPRRVVTVAWIRNWAQRWLARRWFDDYDIVFASSEQMALDVGGNSAKSVSVLPIATNPARFGFAEPRADLACDVLFVGSYWNQHRAVIDALPVLADHGFTVHVYGNGWDAVPSFAGIHRGFLAYDDVPSAYASARVVVDDATLSTIATGSVNSRVFDAVAGGAIVVTNGARGATELFGEDFPTWSDGPSLVALVDAILRDPGPFAERSRAFRDRTLADHTYSHRADSIRDALDTWANATRYALRIGVPSWDVVDRWGDYHFARALQRSLERSGHPTRLHFLPDWSSAVSAREDVTVHIFGLKEAPTRRGQINLLWQISHPDLASAEMFDRYDQAFVASDRFAERMAREARIPVASLHQATDPRRFWPDPTGPAEDLLFVANSRKVQRRIVADLADTEHDLAVYGHGWTADLIDPRFVKGDTILNADLRRYYSSAKIVLNDHWDDMRTEGFISNRIYDAVACGAFVISDHVDGIEEEFGSAVVTYRDADELHDLIERYLADPIERRRLAERGRQVVVERHTFDERARVLEEVADRFGAARPARVLERVSG